MRALVRLAYGKAPDCGRCALGEEHVRREFGCDGSARLEYDEQPQRPPVFWLSCECGGRDPTCERCRRGQRPMYHCPARLLDGHPSGAMVERAFRMCAHYPLLPTSGGVAEQSSTFLDALRVYRSECAAVEKEAHEEAERAAKAQERKRKRG